MRASCLLPQFLGDPRVDSGCIPSLLAWDTHRHSLQDRPAAAAVRFQPPVSIRLPGNYDKFHSPQRWQPELFLEQPVVGEFPFGSSWGQESSAGEVPYRDRACPPFLRRPWHREATQVPRSPGTKCSPSTPGQADLLRASQEPLCKVPAFALPPAVGNLSPSPATWGCCCLCPGGCAQQVTRSQGQGASDVWTHRVPDLCCTSALCHLTTSRWKLPMGQCYQPDMTFATTQVGGAGEAVSH